METISCWISLYNTYCKDSYSPIENDRKFVSHFGIPPQVAETCFIEYFHPEFLPMRVRLLMVLHFLKCYATEDVASSFIGISRPTYRSRIWATLNYLFLSNREISLDRRFDPAPLPGTLLCLFNLLKGIFGNCFMAVDVTECAIERPASREMRNLCSSGRNKENTYGRCVWFR